MTTTPKRIAFKDIAAAPLIWKAPTSVAQENDRADSQEPQDEQATEK